MHQSLRPSLLVPQGFIVESTACEENSTIITVWHSSTFGGLSILRHDFATRQEVQQYGNIAASPFCRAASSIRADMISGKDSVISSKRRARASLDLHCSLSQKL
jgi:hypothetical protein